MQKHILAGLFLNINVYQSEFLHESPNRREKTMNDSNQMNRPEMSLIRTTQHMLTALLELELGGMKEKKERGKST